MTHRTLRRTVLGLASIGALVAAPLPAQTTFDHADFNTLLAAHVRQGLVDYDAFGDDPKFAGYLERLAAFDPATLGRDDQLAFWINAYNAYTIQLINKHEERKSIRNINKTLFLKAYGPWKEKLAVVGGTAYGLDQIEQDIIRPTYKEPRIHFALVCAAIGCPPLRSEAFVGSRLEAQLQSQGEIFLRQSPAKNRVDVASKRVYLSQVFKFRDYKNDFGGTDAAVGRYVAQWYPAGAERTLLESGEFKIVWTDYDWSLNSQARAANASR